MSSLAFSEFFREETMNAKNWCSENVPKSKVNVFFIFWKKKKKETKQNEKKKQKKILWNNPKWIFV